MTETKSTERVKVTTEEALAMLPEGERVHTFRNTNGMLIGADWTKEEVTKALNKNGCELSGPMATAMNHGLVLFDVIGALFIETKHE